ncbi:hypothetical protein ACFORL_02555 [Legionella dresdenensis]|uniref:Lipoprotein n=1 Tax=Legionella dresdenensis TaxID=450200 RepID=A0ABV8CCY8_9GAMM
MKNKAVKILVGIILAGSCAFSCFADEAQTKAEPAQTFQSVCLKAWMERAGEIKDKVDFQNFGEQYCDCAALQQPLNDSEAINHASQVCMSRTLLVDAMNKLDDDEGLDKATKDNIMEYCQDSWALVYPDMNETVKQSAEAYCACAEPKLLDLATKSGDMTDKQFNDAVNGVAATCSGKTGK